MQDKENTSMTWVKLTAKNSADDIYKVWVNLDSAIHLEERNAGTCIYFREGPPPETFTVLERPEAVVSMSTTYCDQYREG
jgi:hypothetical protein